MRRRHPNGFSIADGGRDTAPYFPVTVSPLAWLDGLRSRMYSDLAGTVSAGTNQTVQRVNSAAPLTGFWQTTTSVCGRKDQYGIALEPVDAAVLSNPLAFAAGPGTQINLNDSTLVVSWVQRYSGTMAMCVTGATGWGATALSGLGAVINGVQTELGFTSVMGARHTMSLRWTPTGVIAKLLTNGVVTANLTVPATITSGHPAFDNLAVGAVQAVLYGSVQEIVIVNRAVSNAEMDQLLAYADAIPAPEAFPVAVPSLWAAGDSNVVGVGTTQYDTYKFYLIRALRSAYNLEMVSAGIVGASASNRFDLTLAPFYSVARAKHVCIFAAGANDIATGATGAATLAVAFAQMDLIRAIGGGNRVKLIACSLPDRNGLLSVSHATYRAQKAIFDAGIAASVGTHCDYYADWNTVPEIAADGAADNATYFSGDRVHIATPGHAKLYPLMLAATQAMLL